MKKKKVLFIISTLESGGVSKSVVSLINSFDRESYDVSLYITCTNVDVFGMYLPEDVKIIKNSITNDIFSGVSGLLRLTSHGHLLYAMASIIRIILSLFSKPLMGRWLAFIMPVVSTENYDLIVDYNGQHQLYYMVNKLSSKKKVTFFHSDYSKWPYYYKADKKYLPKVDHIFSISDECVASLKRYFPDCVDKISVMENISSPKMIQRQAEETVEIPSCELLFVTLGHFSRLKGSDFAIEAAKILNSRGIDFKWMFIGKIIDQDLLEAIEHSGIKENMIFKGIQSNPYPYIKAADIFVHPSRFEGKSIALDEAKILCKPVVVTNFSTVHDQFEDGVNASICEMNPESLAEKMLELYENKDICERYVDNLRRNMKDNSGEVRKLYEFLK